MARIEFMVKVPIKIAKKEGMHISSCPSLDIYSQGGSEAEARNNLGEALRLFITSCFERGTLEAVLRECGFRPLRKAAKATPENNKFITVPIPFETATACHA